MASKSPLPDPVAINAANKEAPHQSRVAVGGTSAIVGALGIVLVQVTSREFPDYDWTVLGPALVVLWGGVYTLYGRFKKGLKPLFWKG